MEKPTITVLKRPLAQSPLMENTMPSSTPLELNESPISVYGSFSPVDSQCFSESPTFQNSFYDSQTEISDTGSEVSKPEKLQPQKKMKVKISPPDHFFNKKKAKDDEDIKVLKDMADSMRTITSTLTTSITSKQDMNPHSYYELATMNPEIEAFLQVLKGSLGRIPPISRLACLMELLPIMQKYERA